MFPDELEYVWQEFALARIAGHEDTGDIEAQFVSYNRGFLDGLELAMALEKSRRR
jgi:hypothetical protein